MCLCTWHKLLTYSSYLFIFKWFLHARYTWHGVPTAVSPFPSPGFDLRNAIQTLPGDPPMKWTSSWVPALPLAPKQEELVYQARLTPDSFIVEVVHSWLDYDKLYFVRSVFNISIPVKNDVPWAIQATEWLSPQFKCQRRCIPVEPSLRSLIRSPPNSIQNVHSDEQHLSKNINIVCCP